MTTTLGSTFASLRGDRVVAVDANPDRGTLSQKIPLETTATVRHLLRDAARITRYSDVRAYTSQGPSRLEVLASEQDPAVSEAFSEDDYRRTIDLLEHFYNIVLTDCGTGLMHSAMKGVLDIADSLVIVSSGSVDGARSASATLDWLDAHGYRDLVQRSVAVINSVRPRVARRPGQAGRALRVTLPRGRAASRSTHTWKRARRSSWTGWPQTRGWRCWNWRRRWPTTSRPRSRRATAGGASPPRPGACAAVRPAGGGSRGRRGDRSAARRRSDHPLTGERRHRSRATTSAPTAASRASMPDPSVWVPRG